MPWNKRPATAASGPSPIATVKISTHKMVGTARNSDITALMAFEATRFDRFMAAQSPKTKAITAPSTVVSVARANETKRPSTKSGRVKCPPSPGCVSMVAESPRAFDVASKRGVSP